MRLRSSPSADAASSGAMVVHVRPVLPLSIRRRRKSARDSSKRLKTSSNDAAGRAQPVARVEGRSLSEHAVELEVRERCPEHERAQVVANGELVFGDGELGAHGMLEHVGEQAGERLPRRRVAVGEVLERRHVVRAGEQLADARPRRRGRRARSPASTTRGPSAGCSGRRSGRPPCRCPSRRRSSRPRSRRTSPPTTPAPRPAPPCSCRRGTAGQAGRPRRAARRRAGRFAAGSRTRSSSRADARAAARAAGRRARRR